MKFTTLSVLAIATTLVSACGESDTNTTTQAETQAPAELSTSVAEEATPMEATPVQDAVDAVAETAEEVVEESTPAAEALDETSQSVSESPAPATGEVAPVTEEAAPAYTQ